MPFPDEFYELARRVNNWGRWGDSDELGTVNLITNEHVRTAASLVAQGKRFSLSLPLDKNGIQTGLMPGRVNPIRTMIDINRPMLGDPTLFCNTDDIVVMGLQSATHWDGLAHVSYDGRMYNGYDTNSITVDGAGLCGIEKIESRRPLLIVWRHTALIAWASPGAAPCHGTREPAGISGSELLSALVK